jgi:hypothetical protein
VIDQHGIDKAAAAYPDAAAAVRPIAERWTAVESHEMPEIYRRVAASGGCVLSTSVKEGLGLALIEAQACGCLAIAPDVPGCNEAVSPAHGGLLYAPAMDGAAVARLVIAALADGDQLRARQQAAAEYVRTRFSVERMAEQYQHIYRGTVSLPDPVQPRQAARRRLSPLRHWRAYVTQRLGVGYAQLEASRSLARSGRAYLARAAGLAALRTSPTMFFRPARLAHLLRLLRRNGVDHQQRLVVGGHDAGAVPRVEDLR